MRKISKVLISTTLALSLITGSVPGMQLDGLQTVKGIGALQEMLNAPINVQAATTGETVYETEEEVIRAYQKTQVIDGVIYEFVVDTKWGEDGYVFDTYSYCYVAGFEQKYHADGTPVYTDIEIQDKIQGVNVVAISQKVFQNITELKSVKIGNNIKTINKKAFYGCTGLKIVTIPKNVKNIGEKAFYGCVNLDDVIFEDFSALSTIVINPNTFENTKMYIEDMKNGNCVINSQKVMLAGSFDVNATIKGEEVDYIVGNAISFQNKNVESLTIDGVKLIGKNVLKEYDRRIKNLTLTNINTISRKAFRFDSMQNVTIKNIGEIQESAFRVSSNGKKWGKLAMRNVEHIEKYAFSWCKLKSVKVSKIGTCEGHLFQYCDIKRIKISDVKSIENGLFDVTTVKNGTIKNVKKMGKKMLYHSMVTGKLTLKNVGNLSKKTFKNALDITIKMKSRKSAVVKDAGEMKNKVDPYDYID